MTDERRILLGRVLGAFGVRGELKIQSFTDPESAVLRYQPWTLSQGGSEREGSQHGKTRLRQRPQALLYRRIPHPS